MKKLIKKLIREIANDYIVCKKCGWKWKKSEGGDDTYVCHKCGHNNEDAQGKLK
jgi:DNA-directed RNA polymerase subunit RPC12/RpoP